MPCYLLVNKTGSGGASPKSELEIAEIADLFSRASETCEEFQVDYLELRVHHSPIIMLLGFPSSPEIRAIYLIVFARARVGTKKFERKCLAMRVDLTGKY